MTVESASPAGPCPDGDLIVLPPLEADPLFIDAIDEAFLGDARSLSPQAQPERRLGGAGDFSSLYIRHRSSFSLHARRFVNDKRDIDEVVQETFLRLFLALPEIETELQALAFGRRVLTNLCIDRYRADGRRPRLVDLDESWALDITDESSYDDPVLRAEDAAIVRQALALLSPLHRAALVKREIEEKSLPTIADELRVPEESVKHLLFRARRALRRLLVGSSVDPAVDLTVGQAMSVGTRRLARASATGMKSFLVILIGLVVGMPMLRHGSADEVAGGQPAPGSVRSAPPAASGAHGARPHRHRGPAAAPGVPRRAAGGQTAVPDPVRPGEAVRPSTGAAVPDVVHQHPVQPGPPTVVRDHHPAPGDGGSGPPPPTQPFTVSGAYVGAAQVDAQTSTIGSDGGTTAVSALSARTSDGDLVINQSLTFGPRLEPGSATVNLAVPVPTGQVGYLVEQPEVTATPQSDGSVLVVLTGSAALIGSVNDEATALTGVTATLRLSHELDRVLAEDLVLLVGDQAPRPANPQPVLPWSPPVITTPPSVTNTT
ncbi:MAG: hypothetical protein QOJ03_2859 [Frankiaceae bacterium]|nr:hypothetical protein [Frankiaceae bacterium]